MSLRIPRFRARRFPVGWRAIGGAAVIWLAAACVPAAMAQTSSDAAGSYGSARGITTRTADENGVVRLRDTPAADGARRGAPVAGAPDDNATSPPPYVPGEFELFVNRLAHTGASAPRQAGSASREGRRGERDLRPRDSEGNALTILRFGAELVTASRGMPQDYAPQVPPDYLVSPGDELVLALWGSVDANLRLVVDRAGRVTIPRVGAVLVSGVRYADLHSVIQQQVAQVFKNFQLSVSLGQLRSIRIYVTGFAAQPGSYTVSSLSTIVNALMRTGGPSAAGSFRDIGLYRAGKLVTTFDLYDLLLRGDKSRDRVLQAEDVIQIGAVGPQVALIGSVNKPGIFELKNDETVGDVIRMAAGFSAVADTSRLAVERLVDRDNVRMTQMSLPANAGDRPGNGDVLRAFSLVETVLPMQRQNKRIKVEGEVAHPGEFILPPSSTLNDALRVAGGITPHAFLFGTEFNRESVRVTQQENYERALRDLETQFTQSATTQRVTNADEAAAQNSRSQATSRLIDRLRSVKPTGRIVLQMPVDARSLPDLALEDGDRLYIPPRPTTIGVFGSVVNSGSYIYAAGQSTGDYLRLAGGATRGADVGGTFVLRANGTALSARQKSGWFGMGGGLENLPAEPGDTVFVPEEIDKTTFLQNAKDWTQILYQFGIGIAAIHTLK